MFAKEKNIDLSWGERFNYSNQHKKFPKIYLNRFKETSSNQKECKGNELGRLCGRPLTDLFRRSFAKQTKIFHQRQLNYFSTYPCTTTGRNRDFEDFRKIISTEYPTENKTDSLSFLNKTGENRAGNRNRGKQSV